MMNVKYIDLSVKLESSLIKMVSLSHHVSVKAEKEEGTEIFVVMDTQAIQIRKT